MFKKGLFNKMKRIIGIILTLVIVLSSLVISQFALAETATVSQDLTQTRFLGVLSGTAYSTTFLTCTDNKNSLSNPSFEGVGSVAGKTDAASFTGGGVSISSENFFEGSKSLKFTAGAEEEVAILTFDVIPNSKYQFSLFMNCSEYNAKKGTNLTFGIADPETGYFIDSKESIDFENSLSDSQYANDKPYSGYYKTYQMSPTAYDNEWHITGGFFSTGAKEKLSFVIRGKEVTAFIDKLAIFATEGDVVLGTTHPYWNLAKYWKINEGVMNFKSNKYSDNRHDFILNLRLDNTLTAGKKYTLSTDMTLNADSNLKNFSLYYADTLGLAATGDATADGKTPEGAMALYEKYYLLSGTKKLPTQNFTFTPSTDLLAKGYITLRIHVKPANVTATATKFELKDSNGKLVNVWDFKEFDNGVYTGTDSQFSDTQIETWFPELTEFDTDILNLRNAGGVKYVAPMQKLEHSVLTNQTSELLSVSDDKNLVSNFDFSKGDTSFWTDNTSWMLKDTLKVVNTSHSIQGKSFLYESNRKYPLGIYYIKWIDVEPNTDYTFSARYSIEKAGESFIGIVDGYRNDKVIITQNSLMPKLIGKITFGEDKFIEGYEWQSSGFAFNSKDRNRVGVAILDKGGKAYIDDIRLFKTSDAKALEIPEDNIPDKIISSNEAVTVNNSVINFEGNAVTLNDFRNNFEFGGNIRVWYADGTELKGEDFVGTGCVAKLMNGNVLKDSATVWLKGDITGDGNINAEDLVLLRKAIIGKTSLEGIFADAADLHADSRVNVLDLVAMKKFIMEWDTSVRAVLGTPVLKADGSYNIPFEAVNFQDYSGAYYFKIKLPECLEVQGIKLNGEALADPNYENGTGEYSVDSDNNLILSNIFNDGGDTFTKTTRWEITAAIKDTNAKGSFPIEISDESFVIDMETDMVEFESVNNVLNIK